MGEPDAMPVIDELVAGLYLLPALVWTIIARQLWSYRSARRLAGGMYIVGPLASGAMALQFFVLAAMALSPSVIPRATEMIVVSPWNLVREALWLVSLALLRHLARVVPLPERAPGPRWLALNYALPAVAIALDAALRLRPGATPAQEVIGHHVFEVSFLVLAVLAFRESVRAARPGAWGPEGAGELRRTDLLCIALGGALAVLALPALFAVGAQTTAVALYEVVLGLAIAMPFTFRMLGFVVPELLATSTLLGAIGVVLAAHRSVWSASGAQLHPLVDLGTVLALGILAAPGQQWLRARIDRFVFRRSPSQQVELLDFLHTLSPELGVHECCRRALAELIRVRGLPGAAIILRDGKTIVCGEFKLAPLARVWPRGEAADALPASSFGTAELRVLPRTLREALIEARVGLGASPILSPSRRWGHLFMNTGLLGGTFRQDDLEEFQAFVSQLALVLDGADLLSRAIAVERSLAHAEKLAVIGETAARIAHEIRNPVTAARSLAQLLSREPTSPLNAEHAELILGELERVERQIAALLRFARREEFHFAPIDLGELVRQTIADYAQRLEAAGVRVTIEADVDGVVRGDREKLRQVLVNLIDNALDELAATAGRRELGVKLTGSNGTATLALSDSGPGVPPDALPHLFEPFFSRKEKGTGLGLAIARRTIDAHGGRIAASCASGSGMTFRIELPLGAKVA